VLHKETHRHIVDEAHLGYLLLTATAADQNAVVAVYADDLAGWIIDQGLEWSERGIGCGHQRVP